VLLVARLGFGLRVGEVLEPRSVLMLEVRWVMFEGAQP
jgi:hypothetical protein